MTPQRDQAWDLFKKYNSSDSLQKHALAVEGVMRYFATHFDQADPDIWGIVGLLHDIDYEKYPEQHCVKAAEILRSEGYSDEIIRAVQSHGFGLVSNVEPMSDLEKVLYTMDELTGLITAVALMRPSRSVMDLELKSLQKKFKTPSFASGVDRKIIEQGAVRLGWSLDQVLDSCILAMRSVATTIGLAGESA
ncbi:MAG: HDIG domain-containing protein [Eubacteriales bacterium]|nr:HDIG domain-containing protein [Eubacteriales bacterium]